MADDPKPRQDMSESMPQFAEEFVQVCKSKGFNLDYQPRTLPFVDKFMAAVRTETQQMLANKDPQVSGLFAKNGMWMASYVGEVIRRETGAVWYESDAGLPMLDIGEHQVSIINTITGLLERGKLQQGEVKIETLKQYVDWICRLQREWLDRTLLGKYQSMTELRISMTPDAKLAGFLLGQAQVAVQTAKLKWGESLDFTPGSLNSIESILEQLHTLTKNAPDGEAPSEEQVATVAKIWGIYIGEVVRRHYGGQWSLGADGVLVLSIGEAQIFPVGKARKRIVNGLEDNIPHYFNGLAQVLPR